MIIPSNLTDKNHLKSYFWHIKMNSMKKLILALILSGFLIPFVKAQNGRIPQIDKSPMDMSYYPANYPVLKIQDKVTEPLLARVIYSRPQKNGRTVFGELIEFNAVWRLGANEATELELFKDAKIGTAKVKKGRYTMYAIPVQDKWTIIINRDTDTWGAFKYDAKKDVARVDIKVEKQTESTESFSMFFEKQGASVTLNIFWDNNKATLPIVF
jgi:Protein of unknown function (DUF2911)